MSADQKHTTDTFLLAAQRGDRDAMEAAMGQGMDVNVRDKYGNTALMFSAAAGQIKGTAWLLDQGADKAMANKWGLSVRDWSKWSSNADEIRKLVY